jgi:hypothetical protein
MKASGQKKLRPSQKDRVRGGMHAPAGVQQVREALTRAAVARRLGKSVGAIRFQEGKTLHPRQDADGVWRFDPAEVEALAAKVRSGKADEPATAISPGKLAARACQLFREGKGIVDVVIALEQPFDVVQALYRAFTEDSAGLHLPPPLVERMAALCEVDKLTPQILLQTLEETSRKLSELSGTRHGAQFGRDDSPGSRKKGA